MNPSIKSIAEQMFADMCALYESQYAVQPQGWTVMTVLAMREDGTWHQLDVDDYGANPDPTLPNRAVLDQLQRWPKGTRTVGTVFLAARVIPNEERQIWQYFYVAAADCHESETLAQSYINGAPRTAGARIESVRAFSH